MAGIIHSFTLLCIVLFARTGPLRANGRACRHFDGCFLQHGRGARIPQLLKLTKTDISVWLVTFALTVFADLTVAVEAGMILAALLFINAWLARLRFAGHQ